MQKGTLIHAVFERLIGDWLIEHSDSARPDNTTAWIASEHDVEVMAGRAELVLDELAAPLLAGHLLGHPEMWRARRAQMLTALRRGLRAELADPVTPVASEFTFGRSPSADPLAVAHPPAEWCAYRPPFGQARRNEIVGPRRESATAPTLRPRWCCPSVVGQTVTPLA